MQPRVTHTYVELPVSGAAYKEIKRAFQEAGYDHAIMDDGALDMHGIAVVCMEDVQPVAPETVADDDRTIARIQIAEYEFLCMMITRGVMINRICQATGRPIDQVEAEMAAKYATDGRGYFSRRRVTAVRGAGE